MIAVARDVYGGTTALLEKDLPRFGMRVVRFDPFGDLSLPEGVRLVHIETPTNPLCRVVDVARVAKAAHAAGALLSVDATFAPPPLQRVCALGADLVMHSATKYLGGHSDAIGWVVGGRHEHLQAIEGFRRRTGGSWHRGELAIAQERLVSTSIRRHLGLVLDTYDRSARRDPIVFATLPGERHELGLLMSALMCASRGFRTYYLGPDWPAGEIARFARAVGASVVAVSVVFNEQLATLPQHLQALAEELGAGATVWLGGSATTALGPDSLPDGCLVVPDQYELGRRLDLLAA